jgi:hypothetical protein
MVEALVTTYWITQCRNPESYNVCPDFLPSLKILIPNFLTDLPQSLYCISSACHKQILCWINVLLNLKLCLHIEVCVILLLSCIYLIAGYYLAS